MGTPKWMVYNGKSDEKDDLGVPPFQDAPHFNENDANPMDLEVHDFRTNQCGQTKRRPIKPPMTGDMMAITTIK